MKRFLTFSILIVMLGALSGFVEKSNFDFSTVLSAENRAQLRDDFTIVLDESQPLSSTYVADISHFKANMPNKAEAEKFISNFSMPYVQISLDLNQNKAFIALEFNNITSKWPVEKWNQYLKFK